MTLGRKERSRTHPTDKRLALRRRAAHRGRVIDSPGPVSGLTGGLDRPGWRTFPGRRPSGFERKRYPITVAGAVSEWAHGAAPTSRLPFAPQNEAKAPQARRDCTWVKKAGQAGPGRRKDGICFGYRTGAGKTGRVRDLTYFMSSWVTNMYPSTLEMATTKIICNTMQTPGISRQTLPTVQFKKDFTHRPPDRPF